MIEGTGHDHTLDWWALGILLYELIVGQTPFVSTNKNKMFTKIQTGKILWPSKRKNGFEVSETVKDLIEGLLDKDRS